MARKTYTEEDRARVRQALLDTGLNMAVSKPYRLLTGS